MRAVATPYYAEGVGRPSVDPVVLVKLMLAARWGDRSMRELLRGRASSLTAPLPATASASGCPPTRRSLRRTPVASSLPASSSSVPTLCFALCRAGLARRHPPAVTPSTPRRTRRCESARESRAGRYSRASRGASEAGPEAPGAPQLALAEPRSVRRRSGAARPTRRFPTVPTRSCLQNRGTPDRLHTLRRVSSNRSVFACLGSTPTATRRSRRARRARLACPELASVGADQGYAPSGSTGCSLATPDRLSRPAHGAPTSGARCRRRSRSPRRMPPEPAARASRHLVA